MKVKLKKRMQIVVLTGMMMSILGMIGGCGNHNGPTINLLKNLPANMKSIEASRSEAEEILYQAALKGNLNSNLCFADFDGDGQNEVFCINWDEEANAHIKILGLNVNGDPQMIYNDCVYLNLSTIWYRLYLCPNGDGSYSILVDRSNEVEKELDYQYIGIRKVDGQYETVILSQAEGTKDDLEKESETLQLLIEKSFLVIDGGGEK